MGWSGDKNGKLLALAAAEFDAFVTTILNDGPLDAAGEALLVVLLGEAGAVEKRQEGVASV